MTFCVLDENCSVFDKRTGTSGISFRNPLCEGCRNRSRRELNLLRYDYVDLSQLIAKRDGTSEAKIARPKPGSTPVIDVDIFTLRGQIAEAAGNCELALRKHLGNVHPPVKVREGYALSASVGYIGPRLDDMARVPVFVALRAAEGAFEADGAQALLLLGSLHRRARRVCGVDPKVIRVPGMCPSCSVPALRRHDDDPERYWCQFCNVQVSRQDYLDAQRLWFTGAVTPRSSPR